MATRIATLDQLQYLIAFPFDDPKWKQKLAVGLAFVIAGFLIPILPFLFIAGYMAQLMRSVIDAPGRPSLPEWADWGEMLLRGLRVTASWLIAFFPSIILFVIGYLIMMAPALALDSAEMGDAELGRLVMLQFGGLAVGMLLFGLGMLLLLGLAFFLPGAITHVVATDRFGALFQFSQWWPIMRANLAGFLLADLLVIGVTYLGMALAYIFYFSVVLCCLFPIAIGVVSVYIGLVAAAAFGQAYRVGRQKLGQG